MKVHTIIPGGLYQRGHFGHINAREKARTLDDLGVTMVVNLTPEADPDVPWTVPHYVHHPIPDNSQFVAELPAIDEIVRRAVREITSGDGAVLVHCQMGRNRATLLTSLIVRAVYHIDGKTALAIVRRRRGGSIMDNRYMERYLEGLPCPTS